MKIGILIYSTDSETVRNAFRFGNFALKDEVKVFLLAKGVKCESIDTDKFKVTEQTICGERWKDFACEACFKIRQSKGSEMCPLSIMKDLYEVFKNVIRLLPFRSTTKTRLFRSQQQGRCSLSFTESPASPRTSYSYQPLDAIDCRHKTFNKLRCLSIVKE